MTSATGTACPCGSGDALDVCCGPLHAGAAAPTAERLMRSRFAAFALGLGDYLFNTWDPSTRPPRAELDPDPDLEWRRLLIQDTRAGGTDDDTGEVEFVAIARGPEGRVELRERSRFARSGPEQRWVYVDGDVS